jgi:hypothetical protein
LGAGDDAGDVGIDALRDIFDVGLVGLAGFAPGFLVGLLLGALPLFLTFASAVEVLPAMTTTRETRENRRGRLRVDLR